MKRLMVVGLALSTSFIVSCGGSDGPSVPSNVLRIRGSAAGDYRVAARETFGHELWAMLTGSKAQALGGMDVDHLVAIPASFDGRGGLGDLVLVPIGADGTFSIDLDRTHDWLLLLTKESAIPEERVVAYVTIGVGSESMLAFPVIEATSSEVDLGTVHRDGPDAKSMTPPDTSFSLTAAELLAIARTDDGYRNVINAYMNQEGTVRYEVGPSFVVEAHLGGSSVSADQWASPGFSPYVWTNDSRIDVPSVCAGTSTVTFLPPADITTSLHTFGPDMPMSTAGSTDIGGGNCIGPHINFGTNAGGVQFSVGSGGDIGVIPFPGATPGLWRLKLDGTEVARFDLAVTDPVESGHWVVPVPSVSVAPSASGGVSAVQVHWNEWSAATSAYVPLADPTGLARAGNQMFVEVRATSPSPLGEIVRREAGAPVLDGDVALSTAWNTTAGDPMRIQTIAIGYGIGTTVYRFVWYLN